MGVPPASCLPLLHGEALRKIPWLERAVRWLRARAVCALLLGPGCVLATPRPRKEANNYE